MNSHDGRSTSNVIQYTLYTIVREERGNRVRPFKQYNIDRYFQNVSRRYLNFKRLWSRGEHNIKFKSKKKKL